MSKTWRPAADEDSWKGVPHSRIRHDITSSPAWKALSYTARGLYTDLRARLRKGGNGNIECTPSSMKGVGWKSKTTIYLALAELEALGFIAKTRRGHKGRADVTCSLYRFTDQPSPPHPDKGVIAFTATMDWRGFRTDAEAEAAVSSISEKNTSQPSQSQKTQGQILALSGPDSDHHTPFAGPDSDHHKKHDGQIPALREALK
ncbi:MAG: hypothetical protein H5U26_00730 [Immundisolibacter sp.]|uniref:hypothetical protein n=1 Tax=Immundisolibacter sp. TaxID=1934948 RepID=UPI0019CD6CFE|nr:hypothetical protein [Immundisolibacter sp.]MBC7160620.1 hypothetical protein [Immundisolibacter sp.]